VIEDNVTFRAGQEVLSGRFVRHEGASTSPQLLLVHGAGFSGKERALPLARRLAEKEQVASFAFDFSGHGDSTGAMEESSLSKRVNETRSALSFAKIGPEGSLCAFSMGGHVVLELLDERRPRAIVLFYPAVYTPRVFSIPFKNPLFTSTLREEGSWRESKGFERLRAFQGRLLIVMGEYDEVIPREIPAMLIENAVAARSKELITIPGAPHVLLPTLYRDEELFDRVVKKIASVARDD